VRRRHFIAGLGATVVWPVAARAQQRIPVVAFLSVGSPDSMASRVNSFRKGLSETGFLEGQNVLVEYHWLGGQYEKLKALLDDLAQRRVSVIAIPGSTPASIAAKAAIADIPIVFGVAENPVVLGLVKSLAQPGGNATGINFFAEEASAKRFELMHALLPRATRFAVLVNPANTRYTEATTKSLSDATRGLGIETVFYKASTPDEIDAAFAAMMRERIAALYIGSEAFFASRAVQLATLTARDRLPASFSNRDLVQAGLLMSYGTSLTDVGRQVGVYSGSILKGTKPADLPVIQAAKFEFVINLQTAKALDIEVPPTLLARADEVIE
jgi:ABC-type uncharacterized transport system substrate-binding protein